MSINFQIRPATHQDASAIEAIYRSAFPAEEVDSTNALAQALLENPECYSWVAEDPTTAELLGHISFSPVTIDQHPSFSGFILAPLAVQGDKQKSGIGSALSQHAIAHFKTQGACDTVFVYGDPAYYGRFGFAVESAELLLPKHPLSFPFGWQALHLSQTIDLQGEINTHTALDKPEIW